MEFGSWRINTEEFYQAVHDHPNEAEELGASWIEFSAALKRPLQFQPFAKHGEILPDSSWISVSERAYFSKTLHLLKYFKLAEQFVEWYFEQSRTFVIQISTLFWQHFHDVPNDGEGSASAIDVVELHTRFLDKFSELRGYLDHLEDTLRWIASSTESRAHFLFHRWRAAVQAQLYTAGAAAPLPGLLHAILERHFNAFSRQHRLADDDDENDATGSDDDATPPASVSPRFPEFCTLLHDLNLIAISESVVSEIVFAATDAKLRSLCGGRYDCRLLARARAWFDAVVLGWLRLVLVRSQGAESADESSEATYLQWKTRLEFFFYESFGDLRVSEIWDILIEYPDSTPALLDLRDCLERTNQYSELETACRKVFGARLLHPGANTHDIISTYISTIRALRLVDPSGVTLDRAGAPVRAYLTRREDTIRTIVSSFTDPTSDLFEELNTDDERPPEVDDEVEDSDTEWEPEPAQADPSGSTRLSRKSDIISLLVNIYGSPELFISEYRTMLAERLLNILDYETDNEVRVLELLKLRFGETPLHSCEIMLKDLHESKRINVQCAPKSRATSGRGERDENQPLAAPPLRPGDFQLDATITSHLFWPPFRDEKHTLPELVTNKMEAYGKAYGLFKPSRQLVWRPHLGTVEVELEFDDGQTLELSLTPLQAAIIMHFQDTEVWVLSELAEALGISTSALQKRMSFWINNGIVKEIEKGIYQIMQSPADPSQEGLMADDDDTGRSQQEAAAEQLEQQLRLVENFAVGMLRSLGTRTLDQMHTMLSQFMENYSLSQQQLGDFLSRLAKEDKLEALGGSYSLKK
eukprot:TRINITY_DN27598_c0_g1_i1.p1 TRINITY_DN27598_c0_g1~~TRINITY_DN27598_c0_g1_i1.p1  ORF type:complete len:814 (+),score=307.14 TRINITY_DN27598_c0_g1_i1:142-2583(+)